jgi:hypothetical protein
MMIDLTSHQFEGRREYFRARGLSSAECDARRHALHRRALGRDRSSKAFRNADLDKVVAAFRAVWDDTNLNAQLRQLEQPERRREDMLDRCLDAARVCMGGGDLPPEAVMSYVNGTAQKVFKAELGELDERRLGVVMGMPELIAQRADEVTQAKTLREKQADARRLQKQGKAAAPLLPGFCMPEAKPLPQKKC